jgi:CRP-like cAMP-binding protein
MIRRRTNGTGNRLLDRLDSDDFLRLAPLLETVSLPERQPLYQENDALVHVLFPTSGVLSLTIGTEEGREIEVASVGNEGMVGVMAALGLDTVPVRVLSQVPGQTLRMPVRAFQRAVGRVPQLDHVVRRYIAFCLRAGNQLTACNALHDAASRLCRWLLMAHDRVGSDRFPLTQEFLAEMLGVRRQTVTLLARALQTGGVVTYRRGVLQIVNRAGLEDAACECYQGIRAFYAHALG